MIHKNLINPKNIVVIGGSDNIHSPGGRVLKNLIDHHFKGKLFVVNPKKEMVQGIKSFQNIHDMPNVDLAIIAIAARFIPETVKILAKKKNTKGYIIFSAGFSEKDKAGTQLEQEIVSLIQNAGGTLLGPNNIGLINQNYTGVFTTPIPKLDKKGVDFISGSGATAVFILEAAQSFGLQFSSVYTVGNSAQIGVEEILEYFDTTFDKSKSARVKLLYIESIKNPVKFLKHTTSLIKKGCKIAAIKAGSSEEGNRAASSHTGALASSDVFVNALLEKAGIIRCNGRNELISVAGILLQKESKGKNIAIITHAGGPAVMLTDILSKNKLKIPQIKGVESKKLLSELFDGSSVANPIDFLATGTAEQLEKIIDHCENKFDDIDAMVVIFGSPGLTSVYDVYTILDKKIKSCKKPIYAVLPSVINVQDEITEFISKGNIAFTDEVLFGKALAKVYNAQDNNFTEEHKKSIGNKSITDIINRNNNGYLPAKDAREILKLSGVKFVDQFEINNKTEILKITKELKYPVVQKVIGPLHKSDVGGVILNVQNENELISNFDTLMQIDHATAVLIQPMITGMELFIGAKKEGNFPPIVLCGLGGIFVEVLKDVQAGMVPVSKEKAVKMIDDLKAYPILKGVRGQEGINLDAFANIIVNISNLLQIAPEIVELDINPLLAYKNKITAVDVRIRIEKQFDKPIPSGGEVRA
ncbi:MAG: acetate--CoA ligase family protein [Flavobacteriaceae bacterium]|nr:acetate--CoA ligase family protein [Flavobacteriaceae bacterium]